MYITIDSIFMNFLVIFIFVVIVLVQFYVILVRNGTFLLKKNKSSILDETPATMLKSHISDYIDHQTSSATFDPQKTQKKPKQT